MPATSIDWDSDELPEDLNPVVRQAVTWFGIMHADDVSAETRTSFVDWLGQSSEHARAYDAIERVWRAAEALPRPARGPSLTRRSLLLGGVGLVGVGASAGWLFTFPFADLRTAAAKRLTATLSDGSIVELASRTALELDFSTERRVVRLLEGEAYFTVAPDADRPFSVLAGDGDVTALGTQFAVSRTGSEVAVTVTEHAVAVGLRGQRRDVGENQQLIYGAALGEPVLVDPAMTLAWREGRLVFVSQPFGTVVAALNRWRDGQIVVVDSALNARPVTVIVELEKSGDDLLSQLQAALPIRTVSLTPMLTFVFAA